MKASEKYMLLAALSFFFGSMALAMVGMRSPSPSESYMYNPLEQSENTDIFPVIGIPNRDSTIPCYLKKDYEKVILQITEENGSKLAAQGTMEEDKIEIYAEENGNFTVFIIGPDAIGQSEACKVAGGNDWNITAP